LNFFFNPIFWATATAVYLLLLFELPYSRALRFGLCNFLALFIILGWKIAVSALFLVVLVWLILSGYKRYESRLGQQTQSILGLSVLFFFTLLFLAHKWNHESEVFVSQLERMMPWSRPNIIFSILIALSFSYVFLRIFDLTNSIVWNKMKLLDPLSLLGYLVPFHMLLAGPINVYKEHLEIDKNEPMEHDVDSLLFSINEITTGLFYKVVIAEGIGIYLYGINGTMNLFTWEETAFFVVYMFFDFAGYSKMARGLGRIYGIPTPINFSLPFLSTSMTEFWTRWHISLGDFIRKNLFTPIQLSLVRKCGLKWAQQTNLLTLIISFSFVGIWHRLTWKYFLWGIAMGIVLAIEKCLRDYKSKKSYKPGFLMNWGGRILGPAYVFIVLTTSIFFIAKEIIGT
jgi:alginate O-acetyltransferase complex protein AlgI